MNRIRTILLNSSILWLNEKKTAFFYQYDVLKQKVIKINMYAMTNVVNIYYT